MTELRSILRGAVPLGLLEVLSLLMALVTLPYLMRVLGPVAFGKYAFGVAAAGVLSACVDYGFNQFGPKAVSRITTDGEQRATIFWAIQYTKLQLAAAAVPALAGLAWVLGLHDNYAAVLPPAVAGVAASLLFPQWFLQGAQRYRTLAASAAAARVLAALATMVFVTSPNDAPLAVTLQACTGVVAGLLALCDGGYRVAIRWHKPARGGSRYYLRAGGPLFLSTAAVSAYTTAVPLVIALLATPATVGLFGAADKMRAAVQSIVASVGVAAFPQFSLWMKEDRARGLKAARKVLVLQCALAILAIAAMLMLAEPAILLAVGTSFLPAVPVAQVLVFCIFCTAVSNTLGMQIMLPLNMDRAFSGILSLCAAVGLLAVWLLCSRWQAMGVALAVLGTEALVALLMALTLWHRKVL